MNIGNPNELSMLDLAVWIRDLAGSDSDVVFIDRPTDDPSVRQPDITLARSVLGWSPEVPVEEGLLRTIAWFRSHPELI
jgi:dTDP-glucose 4,6-dehydratase